MFFYLCDMVNNEIIKEIAELIGMGDIVYLHRQTHEILSYPAGAVHDSEYDYLAQEVLDIVDMAQDDYIQFTPLNSNKSYEVMESFVETVQNADFRAVLQSILQGRKPFRAFKNAIEESPQRDDWFDFRSTYHEMLVKDQLDEEADAQE